ncbi:MAG: DUF2808 domain-containing protein [Leptolyngbyaceae bacterium]|nr:DUF2808 domain-containing protein [Leptolyngbyaceae bacterium]
MRYLTQLGIALAVAGMSSLPMLSSQAVQLADGTVYFVAPPQLLKASTTQNATDVWGATYYFTLNLPANAGEPLQRVVITQREGTDNLRFNLDETEVFEGDPASEGAKLTAKATTPNPDTPEVVITFNPPVDPGRTVTIGLRPVQNPDMGGVYLFGVTAFPSGEKSHGQFLGFGRLHFYDGGDWFSRSRLLP